MQVGLVSSRLTSLLDDFKSDIIGHLEVRSRVIWSVVGQLGSVIRKTVLKDRLRQLFELVN